MALDYKVENVAVATRTLSFFRKTGILLIIGQLAGSKNLLNLQCIGNTASIIWPADTMTFTDADTKYYITCVPTHL